MKEYSMKFGKLMIYVKFNARRNYPRLISLGHIISVV